MPSEVKRMRQLEEENRLKKIVADLTVDKTMLQDVIKRKLQGLPVTDALSMRFAMIGKSRSGMPAPRC